HGELVLDLVSKHTDIPVARILDSDNLSQATVRARMIVCWLLHSVFGYNQSSIGRFMGRHHSTVHASLKRAEELRHSSQYTYAIEYIIKEKKNQQKWKQKNPK